MDFVIVPCIVTEKACPLNSFKAACIVSSIVDPPLRWPWRSRLMHKANVSLSS